jgi:hypothetical protein
VEREWELEKGASPNSLSLSWQQLQVQAIIGAEAGDGGAGKVGAIV